MREAVAEATVAQGLRGLATQRRDLASNFADDISHAGQVGIDAGQLIQRFLTLGLIAGDAGSFFKEIAALGRVRGEDLVNLALHHERIGHTANAGVHEEALDILQAGGLPIQEIIAGAFAINAAHDRDLGKGRSQFLFTVRKD